jgi:hypothetical protein
MQASSLRCNALEDPSKAHGESLAECILIMFDPPQGKLTGNVEFSVLSTEEAD